MYDVLQSFTYNEFIKDERKTRGYTTKDLSTKVPLSVGTINHIENSTNILENVNLQFILKEYGLTDSFLIDYDQQINNLMEQFTHYAIFQNYENLDETYNSIKDLSGFHQSNILYTPYTLCYLVFSLYYNKPIDFSIVSYLIEHIDFLTDKYQSLANMYLARYYQININYSTAKSYYDKALFNINKDNTFESMYHYFISNLYAAQNDIPKFYNHIEIATTLFGKERNYQRILNIDIKLGTHFMYLGKYNSAIEILKKALDQSEKYNYEVEKYIILHNLAFANMFLHKFDKAVECYRSFPKDRLQQRHYHGLMISLYNTNQIDEALEICPLGLKSGNEPYYLAFFEAYQTSKDLNEISKKIEKILKKYTYIPVLEQQLLHRLLAYMYHKLGKYKKESDHLTAFIDSFIQL